MRKCSGKNAGQSSDCLYSLRNALPVNTEKEFSRRHRIVMWEMVWKTMENDSKLSPCATGLFEAGGNLKSE